MTQVCLVTASSTHPALPVEKAEKLPLAQKSTEVFKKKLKVDPLLDQKVDRDYDHHIGPKVGGPGAYYSLARNVAQQFREIHTTDPVTGAAFGSVAIVGTVLTLPEHIRKAKTAFAQEDFSRKVNHGSELARKTIGAAFSGAVLSQTAIGLSKSENKFSSMKMAANSLSILASVTSGAIFLLLMIPRINSIREIHKAKQGLNHILNDKTLNKAERHAAINLFLREQLKLTKEERNEITQNVKKELKKSLLKKHKNASQKMIQAHLKVHLKAALKERFLAKKSAKKETFCRTFGQNTIKKLIELSNIRGEDARNEKMDEVIASAKKGLRRQVFINALAILGAALGFGATLVANVLSGGAVALVSLILSVVSTGIWIGFDAYRLSEEIKAKELSGFDIALKVVNLVFFAVALAVSQILQSGPYAFAWFGGISALWISSILYSKYRDKKRSEEKLKKLELQKA